MNTKLKIIYSYVLLVVLYGAGTLLIPPKKGTLHRYHITLLHLRVLDITVVVLYAAIWLCAMYGFYNLRRYYKLIKKNKDGKPLAKITIGIGLLAFWLPITAVYNLYSNFLAEKHTAFTAVVAITQNYLTLLIPFVGFLCISLGARGLAELTKQSFSLRDRNIMLIILIIIGVEYSYLVSNTHNRLNTTDHLPTLLILLTLVVPYIYMWFIGMMAVYEIYLYRLKIAGVVYRNSWRLLAFGIGAIIGVSIVLQYLTTVSERLTHLSLSWVLLVIYALLIVLGLCYILIAIGVRNLKRIEEV
jgi:hypothetical protein